MYVQDERGILDILNKIIQAVEALAENVIKGAIAVVQGIIKGLIAAAKAIIEIGKDKVKEIIEGIINKVIGLGTDAQKCLDPHREELEQLSNKAIENFSKCINDQVASAQALIDGVTNDITAIVAKIEDLKVLAASCSNISCYLQVIAQGTALVNTVPDQIKVWVQTVQDFVQNVERDLPKCVNDEITALQTKIEPIAQDIAECVQNIIPNIPDPKLM